MIGDIKPIVVDGVERWTGCKPRTTKLGERFPIFGGPGSDVPEPMTDSELAEYADNNLIPYHWHTVDQGSQGTCCISAGCGAVMLCRELAGLERVVLSQASLYAFDGIDSRGNLIARTRDDGQAIDTCLELFSKVGACPVDVINQYDWQGYKRGNWPDDWRETAKQYRITEAWDAPSARHMRTGVALGYVGIYGLRSHAVVRISQTEDLNSWGPGWGRNGIGQWAKNMQDLDNGIRQYGGWLLRVTTDPTGDGDI